ncbi:MAG: PxKF domain-containing protein [Gaiellaceae bacterium]
MRAIPLRRTVVCVAALLAAAALPGIAWAHGGATYTAIPVSAAPIVNGDLSDSAWTGAPSYNLTFDNIPATVRYVHTATVLYVGVAVQDLAPGSPASMSVYFDNAHDGVKNVGDDAWNSFVGQTGGDFYWNGSTHDHDAVAGGSSDTVSAATSASGNVVFEISHPLCSTDTGHDICASGGSTLGVQFQYEPGTGPGIFWDAPGASSSTEGDWGDLAIALDTTPPSVVVTAPAAGSNLSGSAVPLTANASDNTGVDHVTFRYFDGAHFYDLGTDYTPPYTGTFNTLLFPDRGVGSATVYAYAYDAAGNQGGAGNGIGLNNNQGVGQTLGTVHGAIDIDAIFLVGMWPNVTVTGTVSATPGHAATSWSAITDSGGNATILSNGRWDLVPGTLVTADDGRGQKSVTLVSIHISGVNFTANTASGTAPPGAAVRTTLFSGQGANLEIDNATADGNGAWAVNVDSAITPGEYLIADTPDQDQDRTRADLSITADQYSVSISGTPTSQAGVGSVALTGANALPPNLITGVPGGPAGTGLGGIGLGGIGLGGIGLGGIKIEDMGLGGIGLGGIALGGIGLGGIGLDGSNLGQNGLGGVPLSTIPLDLPDSWQRRIENYTPLVGTPPQSLTLAQVINTPVVQGVQLKNLDISGSALGGIGLGGIALGGIQLANVGLGGIGLGGIAPTPTQNLQAWCDYINRQPGYHCAGATSLQGETVMDISLQGIGLGGIPFEKIGLGGIDLANTGLGGIPIGTALGGIGLGGIGLGGIDLTGTALGGIALGGINWTGTGLGGIGLGGIGLGGIALGGIPNKSAILNCPTGSYTCPNSDTLAQAAVAGAVKADATVQDIGYYCVAGSSTPQAQWCRIGDKPILMEDFIKNVPATVTLADLLGSLLPHATYDWEKLPLGSVALQDFSSDGGVVTYTVSFSVASAGTNNASADVQVTLPRGARYFKGMSTSTATLTQNEPDFDQFQNTLTWHATFAPGAPQTLTFKAKPGIELETEDATARLVTGFGEGATVLASGPSPAATSITQTFPSNGAATSPQIVAPDKLYLGYTPNGTDRDYFSLPLGTPGAKVTVHLGHLKVDDDLVVFAPTVDPLRAPKPGTAPTLAPNVEPTLEHQSQPIKPEVLNDVPQTPPAGQSVVGVSDNRGLADEEVTFIVPEHAPGANATIQVTSYDGGYSNDPWTLRVEQSPAIPLPTTCSSTPLVGGGTTMAMPKTVGGSTLYLFNSKRFGDIYGATAESNVASKLATVAGRTDAAGGTVVPIDAVSSIATALNAWYSNACSPGAANDVMRAIGKYLDTLPATYKYVVIIGGYDVTPPGLVRDDTSYVNEREYASTFYGSTNNQYLAAYALGYLPTDDAYGDTSYSGSGAYVPEVPVGRLIETAPEITAQIDQYIGLRGAINPTTALVTGYDFLSDGSTAVVEALTKVPVRVSLISDGWTRTQLVDNLFPTGSGPQIDVINAHYDHQRALPAAENNSMTAIPDLYSTGQVLSTANRLVITLGCHSGVPVSDRLFQSALSADWAQTYGAQGAVDYIGNTGFGLGETAGIAYSEKLQLLLAQRLDGSMTVGQALAFAKQEYAGSVPTTSGYQLKVLDEAELYGLPMYQVGTAPAASGVATPKPIDIDPTSGLPSAVFTSTQSYSPHPAATGTYYTPATAPDSAAFENRRPIEPLLKIDVSQPNLLAHGALITSLDSSDTPLPDAAFSRVVDDLSSSSPELGGDVIYPSKLQSVTTLATPTGTQQRLLLFGGQFRGAQLSAGALSAIGKGTQRLFSSFGGVVLYGAPSATDFEAPTFGPVSATSPTPATVAFAVDVTDNTGADGVKRVVALYRDSSTNTWRSTDLSRTGTTTRWSGSGPFGGGTVEWYIQAADGSGNVGVTSNKADLETPIAPPHTGSLTVTLNPTAPTGSGWFVGSVGATISGGPGITYSLDGAPFTAGTQAAIAGTGVHTLHAQGSDGSQTTAIVPIDVTPPRVSVVGPTNVGTAPQVVCADAGSGVDICDHGAFDTTFGAHFVHVHATDKAGNVTDTSLPYVVDSFSGFFQPVDNMPTVNVANAGSAIPIKFSLGLNAGPAVIQPGYPIVKSTGCDPSAPQDLIELTASANSSGLTYDAASNQYTYVWKTASAWAGTCKQLIVRLTDGTYHPATFKFK